MLLCLKLRLLEGRKGVVCGLLLILYDDEHLDPPPPQRGFSIKNSMVDLPLLCTLHIIFLFFSLTNGGDDKMAAILSHLVSDPLFWHKVIRPPLGSLLFPLS